MSLFTNINDLFAGIMKAITRQIFQISEVDNPLFSGASYGSDILRFSVGIFNLVKSQIRLTYLQNYRNPDL